MSRKSPPNDLKLHSTRISAQMLKDLKLRGINDGLSVQDMVNMALAVILYPPEEVAERLKMACVDYEDFMKFTVGLIKNSEKG